MSTDSMALSGAAQQLFEAAMLLSESEREKLADQIYTSLEASAEEKAETAFEATVARRVAEIEKGTAKLVNWEDLQRELQGSIDAARKVQAS